MRRHQTWIFRRALRMFISLHTFVWLYFFQLRQSRFAHVAKGHRLAALIDIISLCVIGSLFYRWISCPP